MKLKDLDLFNLLPHFMRDDENSQAFVYAIQSQLNIVSASIEWARIYSRVDNLSEALLDELAWQFNIPEYNHDYALSIKRNLIKNAMVMHHKRGTVGAVENVIQNIFGTGSLEEWFEYGGEPYHFKVYTSNPKASDEMLADLERVIKETQNIRSHLEAVIVELMESMSVYYGFKLIVMDDVTLKTTGVK